MLSFIEAGLGAVSVRGERRGRGRGGGDEEE